MVKGFESFRSWFSGYEDCYTIIGGTACDLIMSEVDQDFRATKDIDLVLIVEALTADFCRRFWEYIDSGGYEHRNKSTEKPQFYRFTHPTNAAYPTMIELFSRKMDAITLPAGAVLTPIPLEESIASLSAILLDDSYYQFLREGKYILDDVAVLSTPYIIPFKMKAWLDLSERKSAGEQIDSKDIRKHRNDVFRLTELLNPTQTIQTPANVFQDIRRFIELSEDEDFNLKQLGVRMTDKELFERLRQAYGLIR
ncbi:MAG: hypothetical protein Q4D16_26025 [Eubacteriales bacterium]|nr:hypothetical protein [Eubacteriales bacterium]